MKKEIRQEFLCSMTIIDERPAEKLVEEISKKYAEARQIAIKKGVANREIVFYLTQNEERTCVTGDINFFAERDETDDEYVARTIKVAKEGVKAIKKNMKINDRYHERDHGRMERRIKALQKFILNKGKTPFPEKE